jgi:tetratricopeptide (TPR) repeat protein
VDFAYYGKLLLKQKKDSLALNEFEKSISMDDKQQDIVQVMGETYFKNKRYSESIGAYEKLFVLKSKPSSQDYYTLGRAYYFNKQYEGADTVFQKLIELQPNVSISYLWAARTKSNLDPESENGLAKPYYEKVVEKASATPEKNKNDLIEAYSYLGYYHLLKNENAVAKSYWQKVLSLNPNDEKAKQALKAIK